MSEKAGKYSWPQVSPDGERLSLLVREPPRSEVWIYDIGRDFLTRLTTEGNNSGAPSWSPDGEWVTFTSDRTGEPDLYRRRADFSGPAERIVAREYRQAMVSWSSKAIVYGELHPETHADLWALPIEGDAEPRPFVRTPFYEGNSDFSPNGNWIAYMSNESGQFEIYVQPYPGPGRRWRISPNGGAIARWSPNGRELFYYSDDQLWVVDVTTEGGFTVGTPRALFSGVPGMNSWDIAADGQRFVMAKPNEDAMNFEGRHLLIVLNWFEELKRLVPVD